ncbi:hypothetical protein BDW68DRAFT_187741 [Aspergillus falconensis]
MPQAPTGPGGWNFARFASATPAYNATLSDEEHAKMQAGFRDVLGEERLRVPKAENEKKAGAQRRGPLPPDWLRGSGEYWGSLGLWTAAAAVSVVEEMVGSDSGPDSGGIEEFQERVREIVEITFEAALEQGQSAEEIGSARRAEEKDSVAIPDGLSLPIFLIVSPSAVASVLSRTREEKPGATSPRWRSGAPFLLAVAVAEAKGIEDDEEADGLVGRGGKKGWFKLVFRVAAEVLVDELRPVFEEHITTLGKLTRFVQRTEVTEDVLAGGDGQGAGDEDGLDAYGGPACFSPLAWDATVSREPILCIHGE